MDRISLILKRGNVLSNDLFYPTLFAALFWVFFIGIVIKYYSYIKVYLIESEMAIIFWGLLKSTPLPLLIMLLINLMNMILSLLLCWVSILSIPMWELYHLLYSIDIMEVCHSLCYDYDLAEIGVYPGSSKCNSTESNYNVFLASRGTENVPMGGTENVPMGGTGDVSMGGVSPSSSRSTTPTPASSATGGESAVSRNTTPTQETMSSRPRVTTLLPPEEWHSKSTWDKYLYLRDTNMPTELKKFYWENTPDPVKTGMNKYDELVKSGVRIVNGIPMWAPQPPIPLPQPEVSETPPVTNVGDERDQYPWRMKRPQLYTEFIQGYPQHTYPKNSIWGLLGVNPVPKGQSNLMDCGYRDHNQHEWLMREDTYSKEDLRHCAKCYDNLTDGKRYHQCDYCGNRLCFKCKFTITGQTEWRR